MILDLLHVVLFKLQAAEQGTQFVVTPILRKLVYQGLGFWSNGRGLPATFLKKLLFITLTLHIDTSFVLFTTT